MGPRSRCIRNEGIVQGAGGLGLRSRTSSQRLLLMLSMSAEYCDMPWLHHWPIPQIGSGYGTSFTSFATEHGFETAGGVLQGYV